MESKDYNETYFFKFMWSTSRDIKVNIWHGLWKPFTFPEILNRKKDIKISK